MVHQAGCLRNMVDAWAMLHVNESPDVGHATKEGEVMDTFGRGGFAWMVYFHLPCWTGDYKWARKHIDTFKD